MHFTQLPADLLALLRRGTVIPAHLLALDASRRLDRRPPRALSRHYLDAGARMGPALPAMLIAGLSGNTAQARNEAAIALAHGYHAGMLSLAAMKGASEDALIAHCTKVAAGIPLVRFSL